MLGIWAVGWWSGAGIEQEGSGGPALPGAFTPARARWCAVSAAGSPGWCPAGPGRWAGARYIRRGAWAWV